MTEYFRDLIYNKRPIGKEFIHGKILDHQGSEHHIGFYPFPIHHEIEPRISSWILLLEKIESYTNSSKKEKIFCFLIILSLLKKSNKLS